MNDKLKVTALSDEDMEKVTGGTLDEYYDDQGEFDRAWKDLGMYEMNYDNTRKQELFNEWQLGGRQCSAAAFLARL